MWSAYMNLLQLKRLEDGHFLRATIVSSVCLYIYTKKTRRWTFSSCNHRFVRLPARDVRPRLRILLLGNILQTVIPSPFLSCPRWRPNPCANRLRESTQSLRQRGALEPSTARPSARPHLRAPPMTSSWERRPTTSSWERRPRAVREPRPQAPSAATVPATSSCTSLTSGLP